ncbi:hypothetical protein PSSHI_14360 [Photobacterium sp. R1]
MTFHHLMKRLLAVGLLLSSGHVFAECTADEFKQIRNQALSAYKNKDVAGAEQTLSTYYSETCDYYKMSKTSDAVFNQGLWLISDLMFYRKKLGDDLGCVSLGNEVYTQWMVSNPGRHEPKVEKALQTNLAQCEKSLEAQFSKPETCPVKGYEDMAAIPAAWRTQDEQYFEIPCIQFIENSRNMIGDERDGPQLRSEGINDIASFNILYVSQVTPDESQPEDDEVWVNHYALDKLFIKSPNDKLWDTGYCYSFDLRFGKSAGSIYLNGSSSPCNGGHASSLNHVILQMDYPFSVNILKQHTNVVK